MESEASPELIVGFEEEIRSFHERNAQFVAGWSRLEDLIKRVFVREFAPSSRLDQFIFLFGRIVTEDFFEILVLAANSYGIGAMKLLRSMYELAVTTRYLAAHPEELDNFIDFQWVWARKLLRAAEDTFGADFIPKEWMREAEDEATKVKDRFLIDDCRKCGTKRPNYTWSEKDFVTRTKEAGKLGVLLLPAYYLPLQESHGNLSVLASQIEKGANGEIAFINRAQRAKADSALKAAHHILLDIATFVAERFEFGEIRELLAKCWDDFLAVWSPPEVEPTPNTA